MFKRMRTTRNIFSRMERNDDAEWDLFLQTAGGEFYTDEEDDGDKIN